MKVFRKRVETPKGSQLPRVSKLSDSELYSWFNVAVMELGIQFDLWRHHNEPVEEVDTAMEALTEMWAEIRSRENGRNTN